MDAAEDRGVAGGEGGGEVSYIVPFLFLLSLM